VHRRFGSLVLSLTRPGGDVGVCSARFGAAVITAGWPSGLLGGGRR
jgi:hypothetical protein